MLNLTYNRDYGFTARLLKEKLLDLLNDPTQNYLESCCYSLNVSNIKLSANHVALIQTLILKTDCISLNLAHTMFPASALSKIFFRTSIEHPSIEHLNITGNHYTTAEMIDLANTLYRSRIKSLTADRFSVESTGLYDISKQLYPEDSAMFIAVGRQSMRHMVLSRHSVRVAGCAMLRSLLSSSRCMLYTLDLSKSSIGNEGATLLSLGLMKNTTLSLLGLRGDTGISTEGMKCLGKSLSLGPKVNAFELHFSKWSTIRSCSPRSVDHCNLFLAALIKGRRTQPLLSIPAKNLFDSQETQALLTSLLSRVETCPLRLQLLLPPQSQQNQSWSNIKRKEVIQEFKPVLEQSNVEILEVHDGLYSGFADCFARNPTLPLSRPAMELLYALPLPTDMVIVIAEFAITTLFLIIQSWPMCT